MCISFIGEVVLDVTFEEIAARGYLTKFINTHILTLQALRSTVIHNQGKILNICIYILFTCADLLK